MRRLDESTRVFRVFISSPGDVALERDRARQVVARLEKEMAGRVRLLPVLWEDLPLMADMSFQQGIDLVLSSEHGVDIAVFILWSRLGSPLGALVQKADGEPYRSGTEREFDLMLLAREASGCERPYILAYVRDDETGFKTRLQDCPGDALEEMVRQRRLAGEFIRETFHDQDSGTNIRAFHLYNRPTDFASRLTAHLRALLHEMAPGAAGAAGTWIGEPYRGLEFFDVDHAPIFFGREEEACEIQARLQRQADRGCAFVLLLGSSGSGKSSLARAGVIPLLLAPEGGGDVHWVHTVWTPGENPEGLCLGLAKALARALPGLLCDVGGQDDLAGVLARDPDAAFCLGIKSALASEGKKEAGSRTLALLVVDQLEEAFTHGAFSPQDRENFFAALESLAQTGRFQVLATARSDFYAHLQSSPALMRMKEGEGQFDLLPPGPANVQRIISLPAAMAGVVFEKNEAGEGLDQRILNHMAKNPEALPLLEYALRDLYAHRNPEGWLTFSAYEAMGGVEGALGRRAEEVLDGLPEDARRALPRVLHALAGVEEEGEGGVVRRRASREAACPAGEEGAAQLVEALVAARLVIAERDVLYVAHEALLHQWDRAAAWINENRDRLRIRR
ncbi:MAG: DUF4062 domain-containing protein, partial [Proteobacteria bacterium]|nr:DUF4062 domain-containing protein [Pseudomonadota bacterium]